MESLGTSGSFSTLLVAFATISYTSGCPASRCQDVEVAVKDFKQPNLRDPPLVASDVNTPCHSGPDDNDEDGCSVLCFERRGWLVQPLNAALLLEG